MLNRLILGLATTFMLSMPLFSQSLSSNMPYKSPYADAWAVIDSLEQEGLPQSALKETQALAQLAKTEGNQSEWVRTIIYANKFQSLLEEDGLAKAIARVELEAKNASFPVKPVLYSILAGLYHRYLEENRWQIGNRTTNTGERPEEIQLWTIQDLLDETAKCFLLSVDNAELFNIAMEDWQAIAIPGSESTEALRPTLYDFLVHRFIDHFSNEQSFLNEPAYKYTLRDPQCLSTASTFIATDFSGRDSSAYTLKVLHLMQELIKLRLNDENKAALLDLDLKRLQFAYQKLIYAGKEERYETALLSLIEAYKDTPEVLQARYKLAQHYQKLGQSYSPFGDTTYRWKLKTALRLINESDTTDKESYWSGSLKELKRQLLSQSINIQAEQVCLPGQPLLFSVSYRNVPQLHYKLVPLSPQEAYELEGNRNSETMKALINRNSRLSGIISLPDEGDLQQHRTEFPIDAQDFGSYVFLYSTNSAFDASGDVGAVFFTVSELGALYQRNANQLLVAHRAQGQPLQDVTVAYFTTRYNRRERKQELVAHSTEQTDAMGLAELPKNSQKYYVVRLSRGADVQFINNGFSRNNSYEQDASRSVTHFFLDRSIYRPGQTVYFKALTLNYDKNGLPAVLPEQDVTISFRDANRQEVATIELQTNEYGTVQGTFIAPRGGLLGQMSLLSSVGGNSHFFSVEEYKRPKFEVKIEPLTGQQELNDTVTITGIAKAYAGNIIDGAKVAYRVQRSTSYPWSPWWYRMPQSNAMEIANGTSTTLSDGSFNIQFLALPDETVSPENRPEFTYTITVDITDGNGETRSDTRVVRLGYLKLKAEMALPAEADLAQPMMPFELFAQNLDGQAVPAAGQLKIEALAVPKRAFVERYWERPDYYLMTQSDFEQRFPNLPYADEDKKHNWKATTTAFEQEVQLGGQDTLFLNFSGWAVGHYRATLELNDEDGNKVESIKHFVIFDSNKQLLPPGTIAWSKSVKEGKHEPGSTYQRLLGSATNEIPYFIEVEQRNGTTRKEWLRPASWQRINHTVQETDRGNFFVYVQALQYNRFFQFREEVQVPWSNKKLDISYQTFRDKLLPGEDESWTLKISGPGKEAVAAELVATMYDASLDAYRPHNWRFQPYPSNYSSGQWSPQDFSAVYGYTVFARNVLPIYRSDRTYQKLNWCNWDSWYGRGMATTLSAPSMYMDTAAEADEVVAFGIKSRKGEAAPAPSGYEPVVANVITENAPPPSGDTKPPVRKNLKETVFFFPQLRTDEEGNVLIKFTMNEALTRWKFMALAHTASLQYALTEQEVVTQKQLMVQPNAPRFMRQGDKLVFTAKVSNLSEGQLTGGAKLQLFDAASMRPLDLEFGNESAKQVFTVEPGQSQVVAWAINVPEDFSGAIAHRVTAEAGNFADGEESALPILTNRTLVTETMPLPVGGQESKKFTFTAMQESLKSSTAKPHKFALEYTSNPAWYAVKALPYLMEYPYQCTEQIFSKYYANSLASSVANQYPKVQQVFERWRSTDALLSELEKNTELKHLILEQTPWVQNAQSETAQRKRIGLLFDLNRMGYEKAEALRKLKERQSESGGFSWFPGGRESWYITQYLVEGLARLDELGVEDIRSNRDASAILTSGISFIDSEMQEYYSRAKERKDSLLPNIAIHYLYTRTLTANRLLSKPSKEAFKFYLGLASQNWLKRNLYEQAMLAVVFQQNNMENYAEKVMKSLKERALVDEEKGMYWKYDYGFNWYQLPIETHAMLIEAFATVAKDAEAVELLKIWLLKNKQTNHWKTTKATASAVYAMLKFGENWLSYSDPVAIAFPDLPESNYQPKIADAQQSAEAGTGYFKTSWDGHEVTKDFKSIKISNPNPGIAWGAAYWQYFEDLDKVKSFKETPLKMTRALFKETPGDSGPVLTPIDSKSELTPGDKLVVRIDMKVDRAMEYVHLQDMRASGLEPVNVLSRYKWQGGLGYYESTRDASTDFFIDYLPKGTHTFEYALRVSHRGDFTNGMARLQCMYAPEFSSHSGGIRIKVD